MMTTKYMNLLEQLVETKKKFFIFFSYIIFLFFLTILRLDLNINSHLETIKLIKLNKQEGFWNINLIPFKTIKTYYLEYLKDYVTFKSMFSNIIGNILIYIPFGYLLSSIIKKKFIFLCFIFILLIETFQFLTMLGFFDIDDIFLNLIGCIIGYFISKIILHFNTFK